MTSSISSDSESADFQTLHHEFHALNTLLLVVVLGLCILSAYLIKKYKVRKVGGEFRLTLFPQFYYLPESAAALCVGLIVGGIARMITDSKEELKFLSFQVGD